MLSYKSTRKIVLDAADKGVLRILDPVLNSDPVKRVMLLHPEIWTLLETAVSEPRVQKLRADLESFVVGQEISLSFSPYSHRWAYLGLLDPEAEGIWEIRSRDPKPGMRVLGLFAEKDVFIGLGWQLRSVTDKRWPEKRPLGAGSSIEHQFAQIEVLDRWNKIFPELKPLRGSAASELLSENYNCV